MWSFSHCKIQSVFVERPTDARMMSLLSVLIRNELKFFFFIFKFYAQRKDILFELLSIQKREREKKEKNETKYKTIEEEEKMNY